MENNKNTTVGELGEKLKSLEQEISPWAKAGMRTYTQDEHLAYGTSQAIIDFLESKGFIDGKRMRAYWVLFTPTQHRTIKESKPFNTKGDELEVFEKVLAKILLGEGDIDDLNFIKEVEKRIGIELFDEKKGALTIPTMTELKKLKADIKTKMRREAKVSGGVG